MRERTESANSADIAARQLAAIRSFDSYDRLPQLHAETLVVQGTEDRTSPPANAELLVKRIPNAELVMIEGTGHIFVWARTREAAQIVRDFLLC